MSVSTAMRPTLLVDGKNCLYRAIFANQKSDSKQHHMTVMLRFMRSWMLQFNPKDVFVFWDAPRADVWRRKILTTYKDRSGEYTQNVEEDVQSMLITAKEMFSHMNIRQFSRPTMEADDLIYSACRVLSPTPLVICSSDSDYIQIPYKMNNVRVFEPRQGKIIEPEQYDPAVQKALMGCKTDVVEGYDGIGKVKSAKLASDSMARSQFLKNTGRLMFARNMLLVDLSLCPKLLENDLYIMAVLNEAITYSKDTIIGLIQKHKLTGLISEIHDLVVPYKALSKTEDAKIE